MAHNPKFITIEGVDGAGKSSHVEAIVRLLTEGGFSVVHTREPGGTSLGERLREMLLHEPMSPEAETMLMFSARKEHLDSKILPALSSGSFVVCDRFSDSSWAYQGGGKNVSWELLASLEKMTHGDLQPGLTLLFDLPVEVSLERLSKTGKEPDKFESMGEDFFQRVRRAYHDRAKRNHRIRVIDSSRPIEEVAEQTLSILREHLGKYGLTSPPAASAQRAKTSRP